jgi:alpha-tubulin suppressor-like RCC1 family protein
MGVAVLALVLASSRPGPATATPIRDIDAGTDHTCAVTAVGGVRCWGRNDWGQLGDGTVFDSDEPVDVTGLQSGVIDVAVGQGHSCALLDSGNVTCWGDNAAGQLGDGTTSERHVPALVNGLLSSVEAITSGQGHVCALLDTGQVQCWGDKSVGELGDGEAGSGPMNTHRSVYSTSPVSVCTSPGTGSLCTGGAVFSGATAIGAGDYHTCAVVTGGGMRCWGLNEYGQIGDGTAGDSNPLSLDHFYAHPTLVNMLGTTPVAVAGGHGHTCAVNSGGGLQCWGSNSNGQLGDNSLSNRPIPTTVEVDAAGTMAVDLGGLHSCALVTTGGVKCWGEGSSGQIGNNSTQYQPVAVSTHNIGGAVRIAAGGLHSCAILAAGIKCWGDNVYGELGDGTTDQRNTPVDVLSDWSKPPTPTVTDTATQTLTPTLTLTATPSKTATFTRTPGSPTPSSTSPPQHTPTPTLTPTPTETVVPGLDTDGDGCDDERELGGDPAQGGGRDRENVWDFFDTPSEVNVRDGAITAGDLARVVARFGSSGDKALDPLSAPAAAPAYHTAFDRTPPGEDPHGQPHGPNGSVTAQDIALVVDQFGHSCV